MAPKDKTIQKFISFTGPSCSGKTTIIGQCDWSKYTDNYRLVESHTRSLKSKGYQINDKADNTTQVAIIDTHHINYLDYQCDTNKRTYITDRCILDGLIYTQWLYSKSLVDKNIYSYAKAVYDEIINKIDVIFYCNPVEFKNDQDRKISRSDHEFICTMFEEEIIKLTNVIKLTGTVEERLKIIDKHLK